MAEVMLADTVLSRKLKNTRNVSVIAHVDHGKTTLTDALASRGGIISKKNSGTARFTDTRPDEKERGITIKSTGLTMEYEFEGEIYKINTVDSPGHVDFSSEVSAALRITDGALVVVDSVEGVSVQTETVLRQALSERVKPVLIVNKFDRYFFELQLSPEEAVIKITAIIASINSLIGIYQEEDSDVDLTVSLEKGNVILASGLHGWGFTLHDFAKIYLRSNQDINKLMRTLAKPENLVKQVITPLFKFIEVVMSNNREEYSKMMTKLSITCSEEDHKKSPKDKYKLLMQTWLPLSEAILYCTIYHLPNPIEAQKYRVNILYDGELTDPCAVAIRDCDPQGPLMIYISKLIPTDDKGRFYAFGRIFSGTVKPGMKINIMGANYVVGSNSDFFENKTIQRVSTMVGNKTFAVDELSCGNTVALTGVDQFLVKSGTITNFTGAYPIRTMKFSVSSVVKVAVEVKNAADIGRLVDGMKKLSKSDPCVQCYTEETGEHIIAGVGELHIEICLNDLREFVGSDIKVSEPVVPLRESVSVLSDTLCLAKSMNKHNRLYFRAEPLNPDLVEDLTDGTISPNMDPKKIIRHLVEKYNWDINECKKIWSYGPIGDNTNILVDMTRGIQYLTEIKDSIITSFQTMCREGVLCGEPLRGVRFNIYDATIHSDNAHRGGAQIMPAARRAMCASQLTGKPVIMEPMYKVEIQVPNTKVSIVYSSLAQKRGRVINEQATIGSLVSVTGYLPVLESFGFNAFIREATSGQAFPQLVFDHWEEISGDPMDSSSKISQIVRDIRKRKDPKNPKATEIPPLEYYLDKL